MRAENVILSTELGRRAAVPAAFPLRYDYCRIDGSNSGILVFAARSSAEGSRRLKAFIQAKGTNDVFGTHRHNKHRLGISTTPADRLVATHPDHVWALAYQFDVTTTGIASKILHGTDEFTRESLCDIVTPSIDADATVAIADDLVTARGSHPAFIRCGHGPELTANALRERCRLHRSVHRLHRPREPLAEPARSWPYDKCNAELVRFRTTRWRFPL